MRGLILSVCGGTLLASVAFPQERTDYLGDPVNYGAEARRDPVARLMQDLASGERELRWDPERGWLPALLETLGVSDATQVLVFSKTSFQDRLISPTTPRAIYFNDEVALAWIPGAPIMELTGIDPLQGPTFYSLDQESAAPRFTRRDDECLQCHSSSRTRDWPGNLVRSVHPDEKGFPILRSGTFVTTQASPLTERWGGWYVTGTHGEQRHMGNAMVRAGEDGEMIDVSTGANVVDLSPYLDVERYLTPHSDIVALLVLEHQAQMQNLIARASYKGRLADHHQRTMNEAFDEPADNVSDSTRRRYTAAAQDVVDHLLFRDEIALTDAVAGTSAFAREFSAAGRRDSRGRSLRNLDLDRRLFRYPCSYLVYSQAFDELPAPVLDVVWRELWNILHGRDVGRELPGLTQDDRTAILEILLETKENLPAYWE
jgi:hypothetical protein